MKPQVVAVVLLLLVCSAAAADEVRFFPQVGDGTVAQFRFKTSIFLVNTGEDAQAKVEFMKETGEPLEVELAPLGKASSFTIPVPAGNTVVAESPGTGDLQVGYARLTAPPAVGGTAVFTGIDVPSGVVLFEAGVPAASPQRNFSVVLDSLGIRNTGLALVCPSDASPTPGNLTLTLSDESNQQVASFDVSLPAGQKVARYISEFLQGAGQNQAAVDKALEMRGKVSITSSVPVAAVTLRQMVANPFPGGVSTLTAFPVVAGPKWELIWSDEFEGSAIDSSKWGYDTGRGNPAGWGNSELEYYTDRPENARVENGKLIITALKENFLGQQYTSARMKTRDKGDWTYGRFEIRAKLPTGQGIWPAIWMLPTDNFYGGWAASGEIDIMELIGKEPHKIHATIHYNAQWSNNKSSSAGQYVLTSGIFADDFHVFAFEWEPRAMRWYVDGVLYGSQTTWNAAHDHPVAAYPAPFDKRFHLLLNLAVGGNWPGNPDTTTTFPQTMEVDYVRVYKQIN